MALGSTATEHYVPIPTLSCGQGNWKGPWGRLGLCTSALTLPPSRGLPWDPLWLLSTPVHQSPCTAPVLFRSWLPSPQAGQRPLQLQDPKSMLSQGNTCQRQPWPCHLGFRPCGSPRRTSCFDWEVVRNPTLPGQKPDSSSASTYQHLTPHPILWALLGYASCWPCW